MERRCEVGAAVRLLNRAADEPVRVFKESMVQRLIDTSVRSGVGDKLSVLGAVMLRTDVEELRSVVADIRKSMTRFE